MKKMWIYILVGGTLFLLLQNLTILNLAPRLWFTAKKNYPELQDGLESEGLLLKRITGKPRTDDGDTRYSFRGSFDRIVYFPKNNFYTIFERSKNTFYKIDSTGGRIERFKLSAEEAEEFMLPDPRGFVFTKGEVLDLAEDIPKENKFDEIVNAENKMEIGEWEATFMELYEQASNVVYSYHTDQTRSNGEIIYFLRGDHWTKLYRPRESFIFYDQEGEVAVEIGEQFFYAKYDDSHQSYYLKDIRGESYSSTLRMTDYDFHHGVPLQVNMAILDPDLPYPDFGKVKLRAFKKEVYTDEGFFNPGFPVVFYGPGYYQLKMGKRSLKFSTVANRTVFSRVQTDLKLFGPPKKFKDRNSIRFLAYDYRVSLQNNGKKGIYMILKK